MKVIDVTNMSKIVIPVDGISNKVSGSIYAITQNVFEYKDINEMLEIVEKIVMENDKKKIKKISN